MSMRSMIPPYWPTLVIAAVIYISFALLTWFYHSLPAWLVMMTGGYVVAWHGSLQHEATHGRPTRRQWLNEALIFPSLWLWLPFRLYRRTHLLHHCNHYLTDPEHDPESFYLPAATWAALHPLARGYFWCYNTALGRLLLAPFTMVLMFVWNELKRLLNADYRHVNAWLWHMAGCCIVLLWVLGVCRIALTDYLIYFVYPGLMLSALRSFAEHRAAGESAQRSVIIEAGPLLQLLYMNNNLHALHHEEPGIAWYRLSVLWHERRSELLRHNGNYYYRGYHEVLARYLLWPKELPYLSDDNYEIADDSGVNRVSSGII